MHITAKQAKVLENLENIVLRPVGSRMAHFLDGQNCRQQVNSLGAKGLIREDATGRLLQIAEPSGINRRGCGRRATLD